MIRAELRETTVEIIGGGDRYGQIVGLMRTDLFTYYLVKLETGRMVALLRTDFRETWNDDE